MKLADSHIHLFAGGYPGRYGALFPRGGEVATYERIRQAHNVGRALVVGYEGEAWAQGNNAYIARLARNHPWIVPLAFCATALPPARLARQLSAWWRQGFRGISLYCNDLSDCQALLAWPSQAFAALNHKKAILSLNAPMALLDVLSPFFAKLPETRILISHLGSPGRVSKKLTRPTATRLLHPLFRQAKFPHVAVKISGLYACSDHPHDGLSFLLGGLTEHFGHERLYWGSDFAPALDEVAFAQTITPVEGPFFNRAALSAVFGQNLERAINRICD